MIIRVHSDESICDQATAMSNRDHRGFAVLGGARAGSVSVDSRRVIIEQNVRRVPGPGSVENHRMLVSRLFAAAFFAIVLMMESRLEGSLASALH